MIDNQKTKQKTQINRFKKRFYKEHNIHLYVISPIVSIETLTLDKYKELTLECILEDHPKYINYNFSTKCKERNFVMYIQVMSSIAHKNGYSLVSIAESIFRTHATVINSCRTVDNAIETKNKNFCRILEKIQNKINAYVGIIPENIETKDDTKSSSDPIWDQARRFINES
tara:strand:- start:23 stop:535 length:513 start_codon:yes stop_codon:yes gene_type:complete